MQPNGDSTRETLSSVASEIPLDVLEVIFKSLTPYDLATCCRVNKPVHALASEALYRDLRPNRRNVLRLCLKLCNEPNLAHGVRSFTLHDTGVDMYLGIISDALLKLPRLHTLVLFIGMMSSWILPREECPFLLHTFSSGFYFDSPMVSFLQTQPGLKHIGVSMPNPSRVLQTIRPQLLPNIISIFAPMSIVEAIVPGRPVRNITAFSSLDQPPKISCLSASTSPTGIQWLMLNFTYLQVVGCEQLALSAPKLVNFTIDADRVKPDDDEMVDELTAWIEEYLSYAKYLTCLAIRFHPLLSARPCQELDFSDMITSIFAGSAKLVHVIITFYGLKAKYVCKQAPGQDWYIVNN
ncbi:hypothetical protein GALMADRAFT_238029 [Galerina marginata CBS 339.88]|uniref:F-box domain-containing protein n=1 Tax=Galerina marginata (strain CBS 339.88) TaxID=685588 RepID=A0A067TRS8_GALM3|nr:hypothetical protein GALMADRAFT_238029 [Galerina marginata CBS 339.88]